MMLHWKILHVGIIEIGDRGRSWSEPRSPEGETSTQLLAHLRALTRVLMAFKDWENALADAEEVVQVNSATVSA